ncbi:MAG: hypothetical protein U0441_37040 [Polyangiaceae bacterium]
MADHRRDAVVAIGRDPSSLAEVLRRELPRHGLAWGLGLVLALEEERASGGEGALPTWQQALLAIDRQEKRGPALTALTEAQRIDRLAQAVALWLGFTGGPPPTRQLEDWMSDAMLRSAPVGLLLVPFLSDPEERELCLELSGERCDADGMVAFSGRWFDAHGAALVPPIAARLREASAPIFVEKWARVLAAAAPRCPEAIDALVGFVLSGENVAHRRARDVALAAPTETLAALERREIQKRRKKEQALADALAQDCRLSIGVAAREDDAEKQRFLEEALSVDFPAPSPSRPVASRLPRGPLFAALRALRHPATQARREAVAFADGYVSLQPHREDRSVVVLELLALDWHARSQANQEEANQWFADLVKQRSPRQTKPFDAMLAAAEMDAHWEERIGAVLDEIEAEIEAHEDERRAQKEEIRASREKAREAARARFAPVAAALVKERPAWVGKKVLVRDELNGLRLDLGKLYRCGWRREETEESHKFVRYLVRHLGGQKATLRIFDDVYWDEIPKDGTAIASIVLPEPFGGRTPWMERIAGEIAVARVVDGPTKG